MGINPKLRQGLMGHESDQVKKGAQLLDDFEPCDDGQRRCKDIFWVILFYCVVAGVLFFSGQFATGVFDLATKHPPDTKLQNAKESILYTDPEVGAHVLKTGLMAISVACLGSFIGALLFIEFAKRATKAAVYIALFLVPVMMIVTGICLLPVVPVGTCGGLVLIAMGSCWAFCVCFCWKDFIPFTVLLIQVAISVIQTHASIIFISLFGTMLTCLWSLLVLLATLGLHELHSETIKGAADSVPIGDQCVYAVQTFVWFWGCMVAGNACHTACCGVFGRWFFDKDENSRVASSLKVAFVTSFGSICFGSFIIALIRTLEYTVRAMRRQAMEDKNIVVVIILAIVECVIQCIGDILEWFNTFAYVQCAVRGLGFIDAVRATYALCTFANCSLICADSLVGSVVFLGALLASSLGTLCGTGLSAVLVQSHGPVELVGFCAVLGFFVSVMTASSVLQPLQSGVTTLVVCWAENPDGLANKKPELAAQFAKRAMNWTDAEHELVASAPSSSMQPQAGEARSLAAVPMIQAQPAATTQQVAVSVPEGTNSNS